MLGVWECSKKLATVRQQNHFRPICHLAGKYFNIIHNKTNDNYYTQHIMILKLNIFGVFGVHCVQMWTLKYN